MKNPIPVAAFLLACGGTASAQSNVILYGVADIGIEYVNHLGRIPSPANGFDPGPAHDVVRLSSGHRAGSRWGLRGTEDLGNGWNAMFVLESGFNADTGTSQQGGRLFGRQAFVALNNKAFGQFSFGRQYSSIMEAMANFSPTAYGGYEPATLLTGAAFRQDNTAKYTGRFGPVTALAHFSFGTGLALPQFAGASVPLGGNGEVPGSFRRDTAYGAALVYSAQSLGLAAAYDQFNPTVGISSGSLRKAAFSASYALGPAKVMAGYRWGSARDDAGREIQRDDYYWVGTNYQVLPSLTLTLEYSYDNLKSLLGNTANPNPWQVTFMANYSLSKRTELYLSAAYAKNAGLMLDSGATSYANSLALGNSMALGTGENWMIGGVVGIRHVF